MEIGAVVALVVADFVVVRLALLLRERHECGHHEDGSDHDRYQSKSDQVANPDGSCVLDPLLQVDALIHVSSKDDRLDKDP